MTVGDILVSINQASLDTMLPLTAVQTSADIERYYKEGYSIGITATEFAKKYPRLPITRIYAAHNMLAPLYYQTKAGKAHDFNRGMKGRTLELLWEKFQNNSFFVYIHVFVTTCHLKYDIIDT